MFKKVFFILSKEQRLSAGVLGFLLFIGVLLEMLGVGILLPVLTVIADPDYIFPINEIPVIKNLSLSDGLNTTYFLMLSLALLFLIKTIFLIYLGWRSAKFASEMEAEVSTRLLTGYLNEPYIFHTKKNTSELLRNIKIEVAQFIEFIYAFIAVYQPCIALDIAKYIYCLTYTYIWVWSKKWLYDIELSISVA